MRQPQQLEKILLPLRAAWDGEQTVRMALGEMLADHVKWIQFYEMAFASLNSNQLKQWAEMLNTSPERSQTGFLLVEEFLNNSGQIGLALQGQALEQQVRSLMVEQQATATNPFITPWLILCAGPITKCRRFDPTSRVRSNRRP